MNIIDRYFYSVVAMGEFLSKTTSIEKRQSKYKIYLLLLILSLIFMATAPFVAQRYLEPKWLSIIVMTIGIILVCAFMHKWRVYAHSYE